MKTLTIAAVLALGLAGTASAQGMVHGAAPDLPEICLKQSAVGQASTEGAMGVQVDADDRMPT